MVQVRELTADEVEFTLEIEDEDIPIEGSFDSGDEAADKKLVKELYARLNGGDLWAWCSVKVTAKWKDWKGVDYLGACSYDSEEDFKAEGGYWDDMKASALEDLNKGIAKCAEAIAELEVA